MNVVWPAAGIDAAVGGLATAARLDAFDRGRADLRVGHLASDLRDAAPVLVPVADGRGWLAVARVRGSSAVLVSPAGGRRRIAVSELATLVTDSSGDDGRGGTEHLLDLAGTPSDRRARVSLALAAERTATDEVSGCVTVRPDPGSPFAAQCRRAGVVARLVGFTLCHAAAYVSLVISWVVLGRAAVSGTVAGGQVLAWAAWLAAAVPFELAATWLQSSVAVGSGQLLRRRLLHGALRLDVESMRGEGIGRILGRVLEAEAVEDLALGGGLLALLAAVELLLALLALIAGPGVLAAGLLVGWVAVALLLARGYFRARVRWAGRRLALTDDLVEKLLGHRTRLVQQPRSHWHRGEAEALAEYESAGRVLDRRLALLAAVAPRGWVVVGALALLTVSDTASAGELAAGAGGLLLATSALETFVAGLVQLSDARVSWQSVRSVFRAGEQPGSQISAPDAAAGAAPDGSGTPLIVAHDVAFAYVGQPAAALSGVDLVLADGDRVLVSGQSGSGKSTLVSLVAGLRSPTGGRLLLSGRDQAAVGLPEWRRRVVAAPQFHENHLVLGPLALNLLLGRGWPPTPEDMQAAWEICADLGLDRVVERMPMGLVHIVGETGWQLSHGERSLVYLARALLQRADVVVLDESFGALDPTTLRQAVRVTLERAPTVMVVHH